MITFFTCPKLHTGVTKIHQENCFKSLEKINIKKEIIIFDDIDQFKKKNFSKNYYKIVRDIKKNEFGTPFINKIFSEAIYQSKYKYLVYLNSDIIFNDTFFDGLGIIIKSKIKNFIGVGQRINIELNDPIYNFDINYIKNYVNQNFKYQNKWGIDYFIFKKDNFISMPDFLIGRTCWDNWTLNNLKKKNFKLIDCTSIIECFHPKHNYTHIKSKKKKTHHKGTEREYNFLLSGGYKNLYNLNDCNYYLNHNSIKKTSILLRFKNFLIQNFLRLIFYPILKILKY
jgi:hypothetical protein